MKVESLLGFMVVVGYLTKWFSVNLCEKFKWLYLSFDSKQLTAAWDHNFFILDSF